MLFKCKLHDVCTIKSCSICVDNTLHPKICTHRGDHIGKHDCSCADRNVYHCKLHKVYCGKRILTRLDYPAVVHADKPLLLEKQQYRSCSSCQDVSYS